MQIRNERTGAIGRKLTQAQRVDLLQLVRGPGYAVLLDLMESACGIAESRLVNADEDHSRKVLALHKVAKAHWTFFINLQQLINREVEQLTGPEVPIDREAQEIESILNPLVPGPDELEDA